MILRPQRNFTIVRQIANHTDSATYYVRAVIRDAFTDEILDTLNLDDKGGQRFTKNWRVVADPSGLGREISIVTSVYSDSGYTTKSENYGDEENSHLIEDRLLNGRGGGGNIDSATIRRIIKEEIKNIKMTGLEMRWDDILDAIEKIPEYKPTDLSPVLKEIKKIHIPEYKPTDLSPVLKQIKEIPETDLSSVMNALISVENKIDKKIPIDDFTEAIGEMNKNKKLLEKIDGGIYQLIFADKIKEDSELEIDDLITNISK